MRVSNGEQKLFIAEIKTQSPFGFKSKYSWDYLFEMATQYADAIAVHTDPRWGGSFANLELARIHTNMPILAKGIHEKDDDLIRASMLANRVLCVGRVPADNVRMDFQQLIYEPSSLSNLDSMLEQHAISDRTHSKVFLWNQRDLVTGYPKDSVMPRETFEQALERDPQIIQASFIKSIKDVHPKAQSFIVGQYLPEFIQREFGVKI